MLSIGTAHQHCGNGLGPGKGAACTPSCYASEAAGPHGRLPSSDSPHNCSCGRATNSLAATATPAAVGGGWMPRTTTMRQVDTRFSNRIWTVRIGASALRVSEMQSCILSCRPATATLACHASLPARMLGCCRLCVSYIIARCVLSDDPRVSALTMSAGLAAVLPD